MDLARADGFRPNLSHESDATYEAQTKEDKDPFSLPKGPVTRSQTRNLRKAISTWFTPNQSHLQPENKRTRVDSLQVFHLRSLFVGVNLTITSTSTQVFDLSIDLMHTEDPFHLDFYPSVHPSSIKFYQGDKPIIKPQHAAILEFLRQETKATYSSFSKCFIEKLLVVL
ncbi:hypothetical protein F2Q69_00055119 [Brassica cretica]|uniref:Uncharacterized protein n=1 Tax=Brassica cretica TaxID=69181 RepID=A0A8S9MUB8_BRACR|nr:hypothetical protein F2Q69_00055119 [Brassica cretica]